MENITLYNKTVICLKYLIFFDLNTLLYSAMNNVPAKLHDSNLFNPSCHSVDPTLICLSTRGAEAHGGEPHHL